MFMYLVHHIVLDHQCGAPSATDGATEQACTAADCQSCGPPSPTAWKKRKSARGPVCEYIDENDASAPAAEIAAPELLEKIAAGTAFVARGFAWLAHAVLDGMMLGASPTAGVLLATTIPVTLCAIQDAATLIVSHSSTGRPIHQTFALALMLAVGFPLGAWGAVGAESSLAAREALPYVQAAVAGVFSYMAFFEFAPPHTHGRRDSFKMLLAFAGGMGLAYASEAIEQAMCKATPPVAALGMPPTAPLVPLAPLAPPSAWQAVVRPPHSSSPSSMKAAVLKPP